MKIFEFGKGTNICRISGKDSKTLISKKACFAGYLNKGLIYLDIVHNETSEYVLLNYLIVMQRLLPFTIRNMDGYFRLTINIGDKHSRYYLGLLSILRMCFENERWLKKQEEFVEEVSKIQSLDPLPEIIEIFNIHYERGFSGLGHCIVSGNYKAHPHTLKSYTEYFNTSTLTKTVHEAFKPAKTQNPDKGVVEKTANGETLKKPRQRRGVKINIKNAVETDNGMPF